MIKLVDTHRSTSSTPVLPRRLSTSHRYPRYPEVPLVLVPRASDEGPWVSLNLWGIFSQFYCIPKNITKLGSIVSWRWTLAPCTALRCMLRCASGVLAAAAKGFMIFSRLPCGLTILLHSQSVIPTHTL